MTPKLGLTKKPDQPLNHVSTSPDTAASSHGRGNTYSWTHSQSCFYIASLAVVNDPSLYIDSGATDHITADINNFASKDEYIGIEKITVGNGNLLAISHVGSFIISNSAQLLLLKNILRVPHITKSLMSVSKLTLDNNVLAEFRANYYLIKDKNSSKVLFRGRIKDGLCISWNVLQILGQRCFLKAVIHEIQNLMMWRLQAMLVLDMSLWLLINQVVVKWIKS